MFFVFFTFRYPLWYNLEPIRCENGFNLKFHVLVYCGKELIVGDICDCVYFQRDDSKDGYSITVTGTELVEVDDCFR